MASALSKDNKYKVKVCLVVENLNGDFKTTVATFTPRESYNLTLDELTIWLSRNFAGEHLDVADVYIVKNVVCIDLRLYKVINNLYGDSTFNMTLI